jgi:hypothetical protein
MAGGEDDDDDDDDDQDDYVAAEISTGEYTGLHGLSVYILTFAPMLFI